jgi:hypothetical protein
MNASKNAKNFSVMKKCGPTLLKKAAYGVSVTAFSTKPTSQKCWKPPISHEKQSVEDILDIKLY